MTDKEKTEILDDFEYALVRLGLVDLSFRLEDFSDFSPDLRWAENFQILKNEALPQDLLVFQKEKPDWDEARVAIS